MKKQDFINMVAPGAKASYAKYGVFASLVIAQGAYESGWGGSDVAKANNNLFGIKFHGKHDPSLKISQGTKANDGGYYTRYQSISDSILDHGYFLRNNPRYTKAGAFTAKNPQEQVTALKKANYDTAQTLETYVKNIMSIINTNNLTQYDNGTYTGPSANTEDTSTSGQDSTSIPDITVESTNYQVVKGSEKKGDFLFGRRCRITVSDSSSNALDVSQLHCIFSIIKSIQMEPNTSEISIYNLNAQTENNIILNGARITVEAGYEGTQFGLIFDGDILQCVREKEDANTYKLIIIALDSDRAINFDVANFSIMRGQTQRSMVEHITNEAKNPVSLGSISETLNNTTLTRGKVFFGKSSDYLIQIAKSNGLKSYMDSGTLNFINLEELPKDEIIQLNPESGLIGVPEQSDYGVAGQCLLNPQIKLNSLVHIDNSFIKDKVIEFGSSNTVPAAGTVTTTGGATDVRNKILAEAKRICDDPKVQYSQANRNQTIGGITYYDCSSFTKRCFKTAGLEIVDIARYQYAEVKKSGKFISKSEAIPGDLVFWGGDNAHHVAIWAGDDYLYAARGEKGKAPADQVAYHKIYGSPEFGRPKSLIDSDSGMPPSVSSSSDANTTLEDTGTLIRSLDKEGIYRVIKLEYVGDTMGEEWYVNFETITQLGGAIPAVSS